MSDENGHYFGRPVFSPQLRSGYQAPSIEHHFTLINECLQQRSSLESAGSQQLSSRKQKIIQIQHLMSQVINKCENQKQLAKQRIEAVKHIMAKSSMVMRQKLAKNRNRVQNLKIAVQQQIHKQKYIADIAARQIKEEFLGMVDKVSSIKQETEVVSLLPSSQNTLKRLRSEIEAIKERLLAEKLRNQWEPCLTVLEERVRQWKSGLSAANNEYQQELIQLQKQASAAKRQIEGQLLEETRRREQNKQKLLTLLQNSQLPSKLGM